MKKRSKEPFVPDPVPRNVSEDEAKEMIFDLVAHASKTKDWHLLTIVVGAVNALEDVTRHQSRYRFSMLEIEKRLHYERLTKVATRLTKAATKIAKRGTGKFPKKLTTRKAH